MTNTAIAITIATTAFLVFWYPMGVHLFKMMIGYVKDEPVEYEIKCIVDDISGRYGESILENAPLSLLFLLLTLVGALLIYLAVSVVLESGLIIWLAIVPVGYGLLRTARFITRHYTGRSKQ